MGDLKLCTDGTMCHHRDTCDATGVCQKPCMTVETEVGAAWFRKVFKDVGVPGRPIILQDMSAKPSDVAAPTAGSICQTAANLTGGDRAKTHGDKVDNHNNIATLWSAFLGVPITGHQAALMMVLLKVARTKAGVHNPDDYVDMAGYAGVSGEIAERTKE